ncbi:MarR family winged helix-turn-helix transcriptional regulator [Aquibacillus rhizosphaerae]|uniref:MarR family transcriptional regulator n=1 Tax=Aquibacillus rhizosphaerae TaxID=3051431 RepID=A0ABT7L765_9BACI|nr:MarR family transcriptional regulator [Aquibacillus sp. LR5S19]MDL4841055.1 MarR family transcriptional regulator [Aquibacillus sp. LR5S19]
MKKNPGAEIASLIKEINAVMNYRLREAFKDSQLTPPQMMVIFMLAEETQLKVSDISKKMSLANSTVSGILDRLESQGYIKRVRSNADKRVVYIEPAEQLNDLHAFYHQTVANFLANIVEGADEKQVNKMVDGLQTLRDFLKNDEG